MLKAIGCDGDCEACLSVSGGLFNTCSVARSYSGCLHGDVSSRCGRDIHVKAVLGFACVPTDNGDHCRFGGVFGRLKGSHCACHGKASTRDSCRRDTRCCCRDHAACGNRFAKGRALNGASGLS